MTDHFIDKLRKIDFWLLEGSSTLADLHFPYDEFSSQFKDELKRLSLEKEIEPIKFSFFLSHTLDYRESIKDCYNFIDKKIYHQTLTTLEDVGLESSINAICSLLKYTYYNIVLLRINTEYERKRSKFNKGFEELINFIEKKPTSIKLNTNLSGEEFKSDSEDFIALLFNIFLEKIKKDFSSAIILTDAQEKTNTANYILAQPVDQLIFNIIYHIEKFTNYPHTANRDEILQEFKFSNKLLELTYDLCVPIKNLIGLADPAGSPKDYVRNRIKRYLKKYPKMINIFMEDKVDEFNPYTMFPNLDLYMKIIENQKRIKKLRPL